MHSFTTEIDIDIIGSHFCQSGGGKAKIKWTLELELREYGVKSFIINVPDQLVTCDVWRYNEETDEEYQEEVTTQLKDVKIDVADNRRLEGLQPARLEVYQGKATLEFV